MAPGSDLKPPYGLLIFGVVSLLLGVIATFTGDAWSRFGRVVRRVNDPNQFWSLVALQYLIGVCFIGYFLCRVYGLSH